MLTYAFDLLYAMYEEQGYSPSSIPSLILKHNLYGIEIDKRAGELAAFALTMKARQKSRRFFTNPVEPNVCVLEKIHFDQDELKDYIDHIGRDLFTSSLQATLKQFEQADNFGSLIQPEVTDVQGLISILEAKNISEQLFLSETHQKVLQALRQADYLSPRYHVVVANPPYMGGGAMNSKLSDYAKRNFPNSKSDMCTMFIERNLQLAIKGGFVSMITMQSWMFLSSFEKLRATLIDDTTITSMAHLGARAFDSIGGEVVSTTAFIIKNEHGTDRTGSYVRLVDGGSEREKYQSLKEAINNPDCGWFYRVSADEFQKIPGSPIAYWVSKSIINLFKNQKLGEIIDARQGLATSDNNRFYRFWWEIERESRLTTPISRDAALNINKKWVPLNKGGNFRKWYGNMEYVINWENEGYEVIQYAAQLYGSPTRTIKSISEYFKESVSWSDITTSKIGFRHYPSGFIFDTTGHSAFPNEDCQYGYLLAYCNSKLIDKLLFILNPTLHFNVGNFKSLPFLPMSSDQIIYVERLEYSAHIDWDSYETSWDFTTLPLLEAEYRQATLADTYHTIRAHWNDMTLEMQRLEEENNRIFIEAYGLEDDLTPEVPLKEITLTCNPYYRYGDSKSKAELEALLLADTMREFIAYAVGCMFGRYSIDKPGLILANQGETYEDYCTLVPDSSFPADRDNAIPILDSEWFTDDIVSRFRNFLRVTFGEERYEENLRFIEQAISKDLRQYFLKDFYNDHVRRYKKRPIYWMFSSPDGSFNVLIYMHRYRSDTASIVLTEYLREYRFKLASHVESLRRIEANLNASKSDRTKAMKEQDKLKKVQDVLETYERDVLYPLATQKIEIDLDDGVKVNYPKFYPALKKIPGLEAKE